MATTPEQFDVACRRACDYVRSGHLPSAVVAVAENDTLVGVRACNEVGDEDPSMLKRPFALASISKAITGAALAKAWEQGELDYDRPIAEAIAEFGSDPLRRRITIRHILTHTSGLPSRFADACQASGFSRDSILRLLCAGDPVAHEPGTVMAYSSYTYQLLNEVVHRRLGLGLTAFLSEYLFEPLGMTGTGFRPPDWHQVMPAVDHPVPLGEAMERYCALEMSASGLWSTVDDLLRLGNGMLVPNRLLSADTLDTVTRVTLPAPRAGTDGVFSARTLGWVKEPQPAFPRQPDRGFYHGGATGTLLWIDPARGLVFVFLTNRWGSGNEHAFDVLSALY